MKTSEEIIAAMTDVNARLKKGEIDVKTAQAEMRVMTGVLKLVSLEMEHAHRTDRLKPGSNVLRGFRRMA